VVICSGIGAAVEQPLLADQRTARLKRRLKLNSNEYG
jgi:hypothetical protein